MEIVKVNKEEFQKVLLEAGANETGINILKIYK